MHYQLDLFSNLSYTLERGSHGDQFEQHDQRTVVGLAAAKDWDHTLWGMGSHAEVGAQLRHDRIQVGLFNTTARQRISPDFGPDITRDDAVRQTSLSLHLDNALEWTPWLRTVAGVRLDRAFFDVDSSLPVNSRRGVCHADLAQVLSRFWPLGQDRVLPERRPGFSQQ